jgi:hypothetical protein
MANDLHNISKEAEEFFKSTPITVDEKKNAELLKKVPGIIEAHRAALAEKNKGAPAK